MKNNKFEEGGLINKFNVGGSHETSPHKGIPISKNETGGDNLVQEGETKYQDYIFSDDLKLDKKTAKRFYIDSKYVGKTMAEISERYNAEIDERPFDSIAVGTATRSLDKLILVNESLKPSEDLSSTELPSSNEQFELGGAARGQFNTLTASGGGTNIAGNPEDNQFVDTAKDTVAGVLGPFGMLFRGLQKLGQQGGNAIGGDTGAGIADAFSPEESTLSGFTTNKNRDVAEHIGLTVPFLGGILNNQFKEEEAAYKRRDKTAAANNFHRESDFGSARTFFGDNKTQTSSGDVVAKHGGFMKTKKDKKFTGGGYNGQGIADSIGLLGELVGNQRQQKEIDKFNEVWAERGIASQRQSDFKLGGNTRFLYGGDTECGGFNQPPCEKLNGPRANNARDEQVQAYGEPFSEENSVMRDAEAKNFTDIENKPGMFDKLGKGAAKIFGAYGNDAMRLAPIFRNLTKKKETADGTKFPRLRDRYKKPRIDATNIENRISNATGNARRAIMESSGGSGTQASRNIQQLHINELKARSDAGFQQQGFDANQGQIEQAFNKDTNIRNNATSIAEISANEQNQAVTRLKNETMRNAAWEDLGLMGRENKTGRILANTSGYTVDGKKDQGNWLQNLLYGMQGGTSKSELEEEFKKKYGITS